MYAFTGALFGIGSIITMIVIGYDRYNVIVKVDKCLLNVTKLFDLPQGLAGKRISPSMAVIGIIFIWTYAIGITIGPFFGI
mgnify:CR=1 FL=1